MIKGVNLALTNGPFINVVFFSVPAAWFTTNDSGLKCGSKSQDCIGCCIQYPSTHCTTCTNTTDIVLTCSK